MVKFKIARVAATAAASAGLIASFSGVASAHSYNYGQSPTSVVMTDTKTTSTNNVGVTNSVDQSAVTGDATTIAGSSHDKYSKSDDSSSGSGGSATTGAATNSNSFSVDGTIKNSTPAPVVVTPPSTPSKGKTIVMTDTTTTSTNNVAVDSEVSQDAFSGNATVVGGSGGSATTGSATNHNSTSVTLNVQN